MPPRRTRKTGSREQATSSRSGRRTRADAGDKNIPSNPVVEEEEPAVEQVGVEENAGESMVNKYDFEEDGYADNEETNIFLERGISEDQESWTQGELREMRPDAMLNSLEDLRKRSADILSILASDDRDARAIKRDLKKRDSKSAAKLQNFDAQSDPLGDFVGSGRWIRKDVMRRVFRTDALDPIFDIANLAAFSRHFYQEHDPTSGEEELLRTQKWADSFADIFFSDGDELEAIDDVTWKFVLSLRTQVFVHDYLCHRHDEVRLTSPGDLVHQHFFDDSTDVLNPPQWDEDMEEVDRSRLVPKGVGNHPLSSSQMKTFTNHMVELNSLVLPSGSDGEFQDPDADVLLKKYPVDQFLNSLSRWTYDRWVGMEQAYEIDKLVKSIQSGQLPLQIYSQRIQTPDAIENRSQNSAPLNVDNAASPQPPTQIKMPANPNEPPSSVPTRVSSGTSGSKPDLLNMKNIRLLKKKKKLVSKGKQKMQDPEKADILVSNPAPSSHAQRLSKPLSQSLGSPNSKTVEAAHGPTPEAILMISQLEKARSSSGNKENESIKATQSKADNAKQANSPKKKSLFDRQRGATRLSFDSQQELLESSQDAPESGQRAENSVPAGSSRPQMPSDTASRRPHTEEVPARNPSPLKRKRDDERNVSENEDEDDEFGEDSRPENPERKRTRREAPSLPAIEEDDNIIMGDDDEEDQDFDMDDNTNLNRHKPRTFFNYNQAQSPARRRNGHNRQDRDGARRDQSDRPERGGRAPRRGAQRLDNQESDSSGESEQPPLLRDHARDHHPRRDEMRGPRRHAADNLDSLSDEDDAPMSTAQRIDTVRKFKLARPTQRAVRRAWTQREEATLIDLIEEYGTSWAFIRDLGKIPGRTDVQLKDKARNLKMEHLRAGLRLPKNFDFVTLSQKMLDDLQDNVGVVYRPGQNAPAPGA